MVDCGIETVHFFNSSTITINGVSKTIHQNTIDELQKEFNRSQEIFIKNHRYRYPRQDADAWKILEVASMGTLSKLYKNIKHLLPEKAYNTKIRVIVKCNQYLK